MVNSKAAKAERQHQKSDEYHDFQFRGVWVPADLFTALHRRLLKTEDVLVYVIGRGEGSFGISSLRTLLVLRKFSAKQLRASVDRLCAAGLIGREEAGYA